MWASTPDLVQSYTAHVSLRHRREPSLAYVGGTAEVYRDAWGVFCRGRGPLKAAIFPP